jgi:eukaryotic translation initiation factor 2C
MFLERLTAWSDKHQRRLPDNIIYYRDGVSEGQYMKIKDSELKAIKSAYAKLAESRAPGATCKVTAIIAAKRHHTRFFPTQVSDQEGEHMNCKSGTLVDDQVTSPFFTDFFLQSHSGLKGTAKPTHYFVLEDEIGMGVHNIQQFVSSA